MLNNKQSQTCSVLIRHSKPGRDILQNPSPANEKSFEIINVGKNLPNKYRQSRF